MRLATVLLLLGALSGAVPTAVAQAAPPERAVAYAAFGRGGGGHSGFGGGVSRGGSSRGRTGSGWHRHTSGTNSGSHHRMKPWEVILVLIVFVGFFGYLGHLGIKKVRGLFG